MGDQIVAAAVLGNEGTQFGIFYRYLFNAGPHFQDALQGLRVELPAQGEYLLPFFLVEVILGFAQHAEKGSLRGVGDIGENGLLQVVVYRFKYLRKQKAPQFLSFPVDFLIIPPRKVDPFEGACLALARFLNLFEENRSVLLDDDGLAGGQLLHRVKGSIENGLDGRPLRGHHHHFLILVVIGRPDAVRVAEHESIPVPQKTGHGISAIPVFRRFPKDFCQVQAFGDQGGGLHFIKAFLFNIPVELGHGVVQEMPDFFHNRNGVSHLLGVLAELYQVVEKLFDVGHVEISGYNNIPVHPVVLPQEGVNVLDAVFSEGAVPHMAQD